MTASTPEATRIKLRLKEDSQRSRARTDQKMSCPSALTALGRLLGEKRCQWSCIIVYLVWFNSNPTCKMLPLMQQGMTVVG